MGLELSNYLWAADNTPFVLQPDVIPDEESQLLKADSFVTPDLAQILETIRDQHPDLLQYQFKLSALDIEKKLKFQEILPTVNFRYNQLGRGYDIAKTITNPLFENSFQYGISIGIPLRLSAGRGEYKQQN
jgi:outer membrane protein TolC